PGGAEPRGRGPRPLGRCRAGAPGDAGAYPARCGGRHLPAAGAGAGGRPRARRARRRGGRRGGLRRGGSRACPDPQRSEAARAGEPALGRGRRQRRLPRGPCRGRRHRIAGLGRDAAAHVRPLGGAAGLRRRVDRGEPRRGSGNQVGRHQGFGRERLRLAQNRERRAPPGPYLPLRRGREAPYQLRLRLGLPRGGRDHRHRDRREGPQIDTYRASGAGGQHVNRTDSAVRITHLPTNIVVQCQAERSQHRNKAEAMSMLRARLYERALQERESEAQALAEQKSDIGWGHQIRSYVLQPYRMVKDVRTGIESSNPDAVLDGEIDRFLAASLAARIGAPAEASGKS
ncbi:Peptide chain release factor 2, partial [Geodia barretti]